MPKPTPQDGESRSEWDKRCMGNDVMLEEFPDTDQRFAVCSDIWDDRDKSRGSMRNKLNFGFEVKELEEDGTFTGFASVYGNVDRQGDVVEKGAFKRTLEQNDTVPILWQHDPTSPIGVGTLKDSEEGLVIDGKLNLEVQQAREAHALLKQQATKGLSIGYDAIKSKPKGDKRILKELRLWEVSLVTFPANPSATVQRVKEMKSAVTFQDLPLASEGRSWDADKAVSRIRKHLDAEDEPTEEYKQAFLWFDSEEPKNFTSYKFPIADVVDGQLKAVPSAIFNAASRVQQDVDIPSEDVERIKSHLGDYYKKMDMESPFEKQSVIGGDPKFERLLRRVVSHGNLKAVDVKSRATPDALTKSDATLVEAAIEALTTLLDSRVESEPEDSDGKAQHHQRWTVDEAREWVEGRNLEAKEIEVLDNWIHVAVQDAEKFDGFRTETTPFDLAEEDGVKVVVGILREGENEKEEIQAIEFYHGGDIESEEASGDDPEEEKGDPLGLKEINSWIEDYSSSGDQGEEPDEQKDGGDSEQLHSLLDEMRDFAHKSTSDRSDS